MNFEQQSCTTMYGCLFIKKSSSPEKTAQNSGVFRSVPLSHPFSKVGIFFPRPQIGYEKTLKPLRFQGFRAMYLNWSPTMVAEAAGEPTTDRL